MYTPRKTITTVKIMSTSITEKLSCAGLGNVWQKQGSQVEGSRVLVSGLKKDKFSFGYSKLELIFSKYPETGNQRGT